MIDPHRVIVPALVPKIDPEHMFVWRVEYKYKTNTQGWTTGDPFVFPLAAKKSPDHIALWLSAANAPEIAIGVEVTSVKLATPMSNQPD